METSLTDRVRSGVSLSVLSVALTQLIGLGRSVVLARLLAPDDFGLFGMALTLTAALNVLTSFGLSNWIIARDFADEQEARTHLDTIWTVELARHVFLALVLVAAAYPTAHFYRNGKLLPVLLALSVVPLIQGFHNIGLVLQSKRVDWRRLVWLEQLTNLVTTVVAVMVASWTRDVWALVVSQLASVAAGVALSYALDSYRPRLVFDAHVFREAFRYGRHLFVIGVTAYVTTTADNVVVGRVLGAAALGSYLLAYNLATTPVAIVARVFGAVLFPAYYEASGRASSDPDEQGRAARVFVRAFSVTAALLAWVAVLLALLAGDIVRLLYGAKWDEAAPVLRVLALVCFGRGLLQIAGTFIVTIRGPRAEARAKLCESALFLAALYPLTLRYGLAGAAWTGAIVYILALFVRLSIIGTFAPGAQREATRVLWRAVGSGAAGLLAGSLVLTLVQKAPVRLGLGSLVSSVIMLPLMLGLLPAFREEAFGFVARLLRPIRGRVRRVRKNAS